MHWMPTWVPLNLVPWIPRQGWSWRDSCLNWNSSSRNCSDWPALPSQPVCHSSGDWCLVAFYIHTRDKKCKRCRMVQSSHTFSIGLLSVLLIAFLLVLYLLTPALQKMALKAGKHGVGFVYGVVSVHHRSLATSAGPTAKRLPMFGKRKVSSKPVTLSKVCSVCVRVSMGENWHTSLGVVCRWTVTLWQYLQYPWKVIMR